MTHKTVLVELSFEVGEAHPLSFYLFGALHAASTAMWDLHQKEKDLSCDSRLSLDLPFGTKATIITPL